MIFKKVIRNSFKNQNQTFHWLLVNRPLRNTHFSNGNCTGARDTDPPPFSNFLFTNLFSIKFLYFFIISSLFPYFNLFVSIFLQSYVTIKLHVSTLLDTNNTQRMQLGRFKNRTPARFEYIYCTLFPLCHSN